MVDLSSCKVCTECGGLKPYSDFPVRRRNGRESLHSGCRECKRARDRKDAEGTDRKVGIRASATARTSINVAYVASNLSGQRCLNCQSDAQLRYHQTTTGQTPHVLASGNYSRKRIDSAISESLILCDVCQGKAFHYRWMFCQASTYGARLVSSELRVLTNFARSLRMAQKQLDKSNKKA